MTTNKSARIPALDFTKGALVLIMVLYHWINYFYGPNDNRYLRFLTPSFIFITGFLISHIYFPKYGTSAPELSKRLLQRGLKILGVFAVLNITRSLLVRNAQESVVSAGSATRHLFDVYVTGSGVGGGQAKAIAFFTLIPISYLLILAALLLVFLRYFRYTFHAVAVIFLLSAVVLSYLGHSSPNLELLAIGLLGVITGYLTTDEVNAAFAHPYILLIAYLFYLGALTLWNSIYLLQIIGVYLSLMILYLIGQNSSEAGKFSGPVILLGKYSLVGYIAQIAILQLLRIGLRQVNSEAAVLVVSFLMAFGLTVAAVELLDYVRTRSAAVDEFYKFVFA